MKVSYWPLFSVQGFITSMQKLQSKSSTETSSHGTVTPDLNHSLISLFTVLTVSMYMGTLALFTVCLLATFSTIYYHTAFDCFSRSQWSWLQTKYWRFVDLVWYTTYWHCSLGSGTRVMFEFLHFSLLFCWYSRFVTLGLPSSCPIPPTWRWWALSPGWLLKSYRACLCQRLVTPTPMVWWVGF